MRFFFYGTLIDPEVRALALGGLAEGCTVEAARLDGWRRVGVRGRTYPAVVLRPGAATDGVVAHDLPGAALPLLTAYEGPEYEIRELTVQAAAGAIAASVFVAGPSCRTGLLDWRFEDWQRRHRNRFLTRLRGGRLV